MRTLYLILLVSIVLLIPSHIKAQQSKSENQNKPKSRIYHSFFYDDKADNFLVFAGLNKRGWLGDLHDVWKYDLKTNLWEEVGICEAESTDGKIIITTMAYDQESEQYIALNRNGRTWSFNFENNIWKDMNSDPFPSGRAGQGMVYDKESDRIIMFGGFAGNSAKDPVFSDTWAYDYNTNTWTKMNPEISPSARMYFTMAYDIENDKVILWGGRTADPISDNRIWIYDFNKDTWEWKENIGGPKKPLTYSSMVYRSKSKDNFLFGGAVLESTFKGILKNETWSYNLKQNKWKQLIPVVSPPPIADHNMAYNPKKNMIFLFGGELGTLYSNKLSGDSWLFDSKRNTWIKK
jgi:N-acetylneuraminic acid mutarotase